MKKCCSKCKETKLLTEFYSRPKCKFGVGAQCKVCMADHGKTYYKNNKSQVDAKNKRNEEKNKEAYAALRKEWAKKNQPKRNMQARERYKKNAPKENERSKKYFENNPDYRFEYYQENKDHLYGLQVQWKLDNPGKFTEYYAKRRAAELQATLNIPGDEVKIEAIYKESARLTAETGVKHEVDHIVPLQGKDVKGLHVSWNLQILTQRQNRRKRNLLDANINLPNSKGSSEK